MAKGEAKTTNNMIDRQVNSNTGFRDDYNKELLNASHAAYNQGLTERQAITSGYQNFANTGGVSDEDAARLRSLYTGLGSGSNGGGGSYSAPSYTYAGSISPVENKYTELMNGGGVNRYALGTLQDLSGKNGGWSDENLNTMKTAISGLGAIGNTGGYSDSGLSSINSDIQKIRDTGQLDAGMMGRINSALGGYQNLADTGGWNDQMKRDYMNTSTGIIPAMYEQANNAARQAATIQGGAPGLAYSLRNNMKAQAASAQDAARQARLGMENSILANKQSGLSGLSSNSLAAAQAMNSAAYNAASGGASAQQALEQNLVNNKLSGLGSMASTTQGMQDSINNSRLGASNALNNLTQIDLNAALAGTQGLEGVIQNKAQESASQAAAANAASAQSFADQMAKAKFGAGIEQYLLDTTNSNKLSGLGGMTNMYGAVNNEYQNSVDNILKNQQTGNSSINQNLGLRAEYNPNTSTWQNINNTLGTVSNATGALMGGLGSFGSVLPMGSSNPYSSPNLLKNNLQYNQGGTGSQFWG